MATGRSSADALAITDVRSSRVVKRATVVGHVGWSDGVAPTDVTVTCSIAGLVAVAGYSEGRFTCRWPVTTALAHKRLAGSVTLTAVRTTISQTFTLGQPRVP